ncbi:MAG: radical SAM protein [Alphaproteobacteria bacterium]
MSYFSLQQKVALARSIALKKSPLYVQYYVTARCNLACEQCNIIYADGACDELNITQIRAMAANMARIGVCIVLLIGGEPFVRRDLPEIVRAFAEAGIHVRLQTNGLARRQAIEACVEAGAHDISISLDSLRPALQDRINGGFARSWQRAIDTVALVNELFPETGTAFFGTVLMPRNLTDIPPVIDFASRIGWGVSLVPVHTARPEAPRGFRTLDDDGAVTFAPEQVAAVRTLLDRVAAMKRAGYPVYDSQEYLDDIARFVAGEPVRWRRRNGGLCDSPNLYFAVAPNGTLKTCCDFEATRSFGVHEADFPDLFHAGVVAEAVRPVTAACDGCMYGSYPEISISARFLRPMLARFAYFGGGRPRLARLSAAEMTALAATVLEEHGLAG